MIENRVSHVSPYSDLTCLDETDNKDQYELKRSVNKY